MRTNTQQFATSAPVDDPENYFGFAQNWVNMVQLHHDLEEAVQFPGWNPPLDMSQNEAEHRELMVPLSAFGNYLAEVKAGVEPWSATKAEALAEAFLPVLMHHLVAELDTLAPEKIKASGLTEEKLKATHENMAALARTKVDVNKDIPAMLLHNDGDLEWPPTPWTRTPDFKMPRELYEHHKGWWKYAAVQL
ncbi:hypothetical protein EIP91_000309 [Steccherinum ochraceum]|uniref:Hemerythrin-like domain-containing protein n=1 Tax=Steccherinum ochraceum TaxID=92696 RepID=A0A4R0RII4_9APHY|nr:hypothetical protein EIP91_000309 [Steccherinum ochraceum]